MRDIERPPLLLLAAAVALASASTGHTAPPNTTPKPPAFLSVSVGKDHTCAITVEGLSYCWGSNQGGQLENDSTTEGCDLGRNRVPCATSPVPVLGKLKFQTTSAGLNLTCGFTGSGTAHCCRPPRGRAQPAAAPPG
jgi:alpha-tubulin suppressor-like RCC1 family protein